MITYFAKFHLNKDGQYEVTFPDLDPYAATFGASLQDAIKSAHDALAGYLLTAEDTHEHVATPSQKPQKDWLTNQDDWLMPVSVNLELEREKEQNTVVKKTLTIPKYLNDLGKDAKINFSATLTEALKHKLNA
jgi:antitoxin HicB